MNFWTRRVALTLVVALVVLGVAVGLVCAAFWQRYEQALHILEPRIERLSGIVKADSDIDAALNGANESLKLWLHAGGGKAQNDIQQHLRQIIDTTGATIVASQSVFESGDAQRLGRIRLTATVTGEWSKIVSLLEALQAQRPPFWVRSASLFRENGNAAVEPQIVRLTLQLEAPLAGEVSQ